MKLNKVIITLAIGLLIFSACEEKAKEQKKSLLCGNITNAKEDIATISNGNSVDTISLDNGGSFCHELNLNHGSYLVFSHGKEITTLFLEPGDSLFLTLDTKEFDETVVYSGNGAKKNNFLAKEYLENEQVQIDYKSLYSLSTDSFLFIVDSAMNAGKDKLLKNSFSEEFSKLEEAKLIMTNGISKLNYPSYYEYFQGGKKAELPEDWYNFISMVDVNDSKLQSLKEFSNYLNILISFKAEELIEADSELSERKHGSTAATLSVISNLITNTKHKNKLLYKNMSEHVKYNSINNIEALLADFESLCNDAELVSNIKDEIAKWDMLKEGMPAPIFAYSDINGKEYSLTDFLGKYVYVDVWATWCGPCKREIPFLKEIIEEFKDKNVVFMSVSVDNTPEPWKEMLAEDEMHGLQLYAEGAWKSSIVKDYMISGIPRFILIDTEGKIIDVRASRPSGDIKEILNSLEKI